MPTREARARRASQATTIVCGVIGDKLRCSSTEALTGQSVAKLPPSSHKNMAMKTPLNTMLGRIAPAMKAAQSTWSPFQSTEVREICAHLTPAEHAQLIADARQRGSDIGRWIAGPLGVTVGLLFWSWQVGLALLALYVVYFAFSGYARLRAMRCRSMELLCETEWARSRGYTPDRLRLMTFPWTR